tara:strand:+ start:41560 stop:41850 length:291 start_codon:yes stop_codon:yes gene_type:complete
MPVGSCMHLRRPDLQQRASTPGAKHCKGRANPDCGQTAQTKDFDMYSMDEFLRLNGSDSFTRTLDRSRERAGVRLRGGGHDVNSFLSACGLKARRK